jgi:hypothetical protein
MVAAVDSFGNLVGYDLLRGTRRVLAISAAGWPEGPVMVADQPFYISDGQAFTPASPAALATADGLVPVSGLQELWATPSGDAAHQFASLFHVQGGWSLVTRVGLDRGDTPVAAGPSRIAVLHSGDIVFRDANTGRVSGGAGPVAHDYDVVGAAGDSIVYADTGSCRISCPLAIVDMVDQSAMLVAPPAGTTSFIGGGSVNAAGDIAAFASIGDSSSGKAEIVIDSVSGLRALPTPFDVEEPVGAAAWDPTGRWVVFGGPRATYLLDTATMRTTLLPFIAGYSFTVLAP